MKLLSARALPITFLLAMVLVVLIFIWGILENGIDLIEAAPQPASNNLPFVWYDDATGGAVYVRRPRQAETQPTSSNDDYQSNKQVPSQPGGGTGTNSSSSSSITNRVENSGTAVAKDKADQQTTASKESPMSLLASLLASLDNGGDQQPPSVVPLKKQEPPSSPPPPPQILRTQEEEEPSPPSQQHQDLPDFSSLFGSLFGQQPTTTPVPVTTTQPPPPPAQDLLSSLFSSFTQGQPQQQPTPAQPKSADQGLPDLSSLFALFSPQPPPPQGGPLGLLTTLAPVVRQFWPVLEPMVREHLPSLVRGFVINYILPRASQIGEFFKSGMAGMGQNFGQLFPGLFGGVAPAALPAGQRRFEIDAAAGAGGLGRDYGAPTASDIPQDFRRMYQYAGSDQPSMYRSPAHQASSYTGQYSQPSVLADPYGANNYQQYQGYPQLDQGTYRDDSSSMVAPGQQDASLMTMPGPSSYYQEHMSPAIENGRSSSAADDPAYSYEQEQQQRVEVAQPSRTRAQNATTSGAQPAAEGPSTADGSPYGISRGSSPGGGSQQMPKIGVHWFTSSRYGDKFSNRRRAQQAAASQGSSSA